jgi:hypothetical protein
MRPTRILPKTAGWPQRMDSEPAHLATAKMIASISSSCNRCDISENGRVIIL